eukprot:m.31063 g.31063  ORF g.31063 m.31063 type:complete len:50 (+) comp31430_c0_seq2:354-503(+)
MSCICLQTFCTYFISLIIIMSAILTETMELTASEINHTFANLDTKLKAI